MSKRFDYCVVCGQSIKTKRAGTMTCSDNCRKELSLMRGRISRAHEAILDDLGYLESMANHPVLAGRAKDAIQGVLEISLAVSNRVKGIRYVGDDWFMSFGSDGQMRITKLDFEVSEDGGEEKTG